MKEVFARFIGSTVSLLSLITIFSLASCAPSPAVHTAERRVWRYTSFTRLDIRMLSLPTGCVSIPPQASCDDFINSMEPVSMTGTGSGMVVHHRNGLTYVLTAAHVCQDRSQRSIQISTVLGDAELSIEQRISLISIDYYGNRHTTRVLSVDNENDICLIDSPGTWGYPVPVSSNEPEIGEIVYNVAAPLGIFEPRMVPIFDGRFVGADPTGRRFYSIPTGPGSSGSAILNNRGEIVGMIHSAFTQFENLAISASLADIRSMLRSVEDQ